MTHVVDRLAAWVGGELGTSEAAAVAAHLEACGDCRREADRLRATWRMLDAVAMPAATPAVTVWPAVRARTFGEPAAGWFFGGSPAIRWSLAAATLAVGVLCGRFSGQLAGPRAAMAEDDSSLAAVWFEDSSWHNESAGGLAGSWLAMAGNGSGQAGSDRRGGTQ